MKLCRDGRQSWSIGFAFPPFASPIKRHGMRVEDTIPETTTMSRFFRHYHREEQVSNPPPPSYDYLGGRPPPPRTVRIYTKAEPNYSLSIRDGEVILAPNDPQDDYQARRTHVHSPCIDSPSLSLLFCCLWTALQHWYKDMRYSNQVKDEEGFPSFALVNKVTGEAIKHSIGAKNPVSHRLPHAALVVLREFIVSSTIPCRFG